MPPRMRHTLVVLVTLVTFMVGEVKADPVEDCKPEQTHLSYGQDTTEMVVMWATKGNCRPSVNISFTDPTNLDKATPGESRLFDADSNEDGLQYFHRVHLRNLPPGKLTYYKPISSFYDSKGEKTEVTDNWFFFKTPKQHLEPVPTTPTPTRTGSSIDDNDNWKPVLPVTSSTPENTKHEKVEFFIVSDLKTSSNSINFFNKEVSSNKYNVILHVGNLAMNLSTDEGENADKYFEQIEQAVASVPYMTTPGELEMEAGSHSHYVHRLSMPQSSWPITNDRMWYSIDIGHVHVISFCTDTFYTLEGTFVDVQHDWLIQDLQKANENRHNVPWVVAFGREPLYCTYEDPDMACNKKISKVRKGLEDIFYTFGVDIVVQSNGRGYERSLPMYKGIAVNENYTNPLGPVFIDTGGASTWEPEYNFTDPAPEWLAKRITNHTEAAFGRLRFINATTAEFEQVSLSNGEVLDTFVITQESHGGFVIETLSPNISKEIKDEMESRGEKPGTYGYGNNGELNINEIGDTKSKTGLTELLKGDNKTRVIIGATFGSFIAVVLFIFLYVRRSKRRNRVTRRWEHMDINYGKKFYDKAPDQDDENDFEIDMIEGTEPSRKLLSDD